MRRLKRWLLLSLVACFLFNASVLTGCNPGEKEPKHQYDVLSLGEIPVGLWVTPPAEYINEEQYRTMRESGINFVNGFYEGTDENIKKAMDLSYQNGMKFLVSQREIEANIRAYKENPDESLITQSMELIKKHSDHPAYAGQLFIDEPGKPMFRSVDAFIKAYEKEFPGRFWHVNMLPTYSRLLGASTYEDYVESWLEMTNAPYFSYDSYPCLEVDEDAYNPRYEIEDYFYNLDYLRKTTRDAGIPLWSFIQTVPIFGVTTEPDKRTPSREDIRWQVYVNLAFGVKGIQYFCYWTSIQTTFKDNFAMISPTGEKTERYDYVQEVNRDFNEFGKILLNCNSEGIILNKKSSDRRFELYYEPIRSFGPITSVEGETFVTGCFTNQDTGRKSVLITPCTPRDSVEGVLNLDKSVKTVEIYLNGEKKTQEIRNGEMAFQIDAGDAIFIQF